MKLFPSVIALANGFVILSYYVSSASGDDGKNTRNSGEVHLCTGDCFREPSSQATSTPYTRHTHTQRIKGKNYYTLILAQRAEKR